MELILKLTECCNYGCTFCRYANTRRSDNGMPLSLVEKCIRDCVQYNLGQGIRDNIVNFHGGEPLLYGIERMETIMNLEETIAAEYDVEFKNRIQTNGSLMNEAWCDFFRKNHFDIGLSFDGPGNLNQHRALNGEDSEKRFLQTVDLLKRQGLRFGVISVITPAHVGREQEWFDFFVDAGIRSVGMSFCYNEDFGGNIDTAELSKFLIRIFEINYNSPADISIREIKEPVCRMLGKGLYICSEMHRGMCGMFPTVTPDGNVTFCDDDNRKHSIGNINEQTFAEMFEGEKYKKYLAEVLAFPETVCSKCEIRDICGGGCPRYNQSADRNYFCDTYREFYPYVQARVNELINARSVFSLIKLKKLS